MGMHEKLRNGMVNEEYNPSAEQDTILQLLTDGRDRGEPWGYITPRHVREQTDLEQDNIGYHLRQLTSAGWVQRVTRGFYVFVEDPREQYSKHNNTDS